MASYDVIIIGAGPGGYVSAIRCAQLGLKTAVVEGRDTLGGTCLNVGCIPSKALLNATHHLHEAEHNFAKMGLKGKSPSVDWDQMKSYKDDVVGQNTGGIEFLFKKNKIDWIKGWATLPAVGKVKVGDDIHEAKNIVIATGSVPTSLPGVEVNNDGGVVVDSTGALDLPKVPKKLAVIGAGAAMAHAVDPARAGSAQGLLRGIGLAAATIAAMVSGLAYEAGGPLLLFGGTGVAVVVIAVAGMLFVRWHPLARP